MEVGRKGTGGDGKEGNPLRGGELVGACYSLRAPERLGYMDLTPSDLLNASAAPTKHDKSITSVSIDQGAPRHLRSVLMGELDLDLLETWISGLLETDGASIYRVRRAGSEPTHLNPAGNGRRRIHLSCETSGIRTYAPEPT